MKLAVASGDVETSRQATAAIDFQPLKDLALALTAGATRTLYGSGRALEPDAPVATSDASESLPQIYQRAGGIADHAQRAVALTALIAVLDRPTQQAAIKKALEAISQVREPFSRAQSLLGLACCPCVADPADALGKIVEALSCEGQSGIRAAVEARLVPRLIALSEADMHKCLRAMFPAITTIPRPGVLRILRALSGPVSTLSGPRGLAEISRAVHEAAQWWP